MRILKGLFVVFALITSVLPALSAELVMYRRAGCPYCQAWDREIAPAYPKTYIGKRLPLANFPSMPRRIYGSYCSAPF